MFILAVILLGLAVVALLTAIIGPKVAKPNYHGEMPNFGFSYVAAVAFFGLSLLLGLASSAYSQDPGEAIVLKSFTGEIIGVDETEGLGFTAPWNDKISFNLRNQILTFDDEDSALSDSSSARFDIAVTYSARGNCVGDIYKKYQTQANLEEKVLRRGIRSALKEQTVKFEPLKILENRPTLTSNLSTGLAEKFDDECVTIDSVDIVDIQLDGTIQQSIADRNAAKIAVQKAEEEYRKSQVNILQQLNESKAASDKIAISQCGGTEVQVTEVVNNQEVTNTKIVPNSPENCQNLINPNTIAMKQIEAMAEIGRAGNMVIISPDGTMPVINMPTNG